MKNQFTAFHKIEQFRQAYRKITENIRFCGFSEETEEPIFDYDMVLPTVTAKGTVKLHGTNAGISLNINTMEIFTTSKKNIITPENDNAGFASYVEANKAYYHKVLHSIHSQLVRLYGEHVLGVTLFGEWCGGNIQKRVAISQLPKMFVTFSVKVDFGSHSFYCNSSEFYQDRYLDSYYDIRDFKQFEVEIDLNNPKKAMQQMEAYTLEVEKECPVAKAFGISGLGEGIVYTIEHEGSTYNFKIKGEKHSATKTKKLVSIDPVKLDSINNFIEYAATDNRMQQGLQLVFQDKPLDVKLLGEFVRWVLNDTVTEESDVLEANALIVKDVQKSISTKARNFFFHKYNNEF